MPRKLPPLNALRAFEAAARQLSFTKAAAELYVTQAAVSHQVKALEEHLGMPLFRRYNRRLVLTEAGQSYLPALSDAFDAMDQATQRLQRQKHSGPVRITVLPSLAAKWLMPRLPRFRERHPAIDVLISAADTLVDLIREDFHIGLRFGAGRYPGLKVTQLMGDRVFPVCAPRLLKGAVPLKRIADLQNHTLLHDDMARSDESSNDWASWLKFAGAQDIDPRGGPAFSHSSLALTAAIDSQGVALGRMSLVEDDLAAGRLVCPFGPVMESPMAYYVVLPPAAIERVRVRLFYDWLLEEAAETGERQVPLPSC